MLGGGGGGEKEREVRGCVMICMSTWHRNECAVEGMVCRWMDDEYASGWMDG